MAFSDNSKLDKSFKTLINKEFSTTAKAFYEEFGANTININTGEVWAESVSSTPATAVSNGVARQLTQFTLSPVAGYTTSVFYLVSGSGFTPGTTINRATIDTTLLQRNFIGDKYGTSYAAQLFDNAGNQIFPTDAIDWFFDYVTGILFIQDPGAYSTPYKVTVYQYTGKTLTSPSLPYSGSFSGSFQGNGSGLTNVPASGIVGLNLTQIADSQVSASVSATGTSFTVSSASVNLITVDSSSRVTATTFSGSLVGTSNTTGSLTGSFVGVGSGSFSGSFQGNGSGLTDLPASSIVGLNLSQTATGSVSASVNVGTTSFQIISGSTTLLSLTNTGNLTVSGSEFIGNNLTAIGNATVTGSLIVNGTTNLNSTLTVAGSSSLIDTTVTGSLLVTQNFTVLGTASFNRITGSNLVIGTNLIILNTDNPAVRFGGMVVVDSGSFGTNSTSSFLYDSEKNQWLFQHEGASEQTGSSISIFGPLNNGALGDEIGLTEYAIPRAYTDHGHHIGDSNIYSSGSNVTINKGTTGSLSGVEILGNLEVTGSLNLTGSVNITNQISASTILSQYSNIGLPEDGTYTDGLYTDITDNTYVGTMIDRFNEVLKGLSPSPAPDLDNLESVSSGTNSQYLAFGASLSTSSYSNVTGTGSLSAVNFTQQFNQSTGTGGGRLRLGTFSATTTLTIRLNEDVSADGSPFTNYPANSFNVPVAGGESYTLEINGNIYTETTSGTNSLSGTYFTLSSAATGFFPATGLPFNIFRNRTGTVSIPAGLWRSGWNFVRVKQGTNITNFVDWVYDPAAASGNFPYSFNDFTTSSVAPTGEKALSGIKYYTGFSYIVTGSISNYYKNVYNTGNKSFTGVSSGLTAAQIVIPPPITAESLIQVTSSHTFASSGQRLLSQSLSSTLTITNDFSKTGTAGAIITPVILLDNINTANTTIAENFCLEDRRIPSASYDTQISATNAIGTFPSASALGSSDLAIYAGTLRYPTQVLNSGNVAGAGVIYAIAGQPNYSGVSEERWFFRTFQNGGNAVATFTLSISGTNINFTAFGGTLSGNAVKIWIKVPGKTGWRDIMTAAPASTAGIATNDNVGCQTGGAPSNITSQATRTIGIDLKTEAMLPSDYFVIRVQTSSGWAGTMNQINLTGF
jgi:hypothetical protein